MNSSTLPLNVFPQTAEAARAEQWNATYQHQLTGDSTFELGYVGNKAMGLDMIIMGDNAPWSLDGSVSSSSMAFDVDDRPRRLRQIDGTGLASRAANPVQGSKGRLGGL